jgi:hypothetical protein
MLNLGMFPSLEVASFDAWVHYPEKCAEVLLPSQQLPPQMKETLKQQLNHSHNSAAISWPLDHRFVGQSPV